ncbi:MAG: hypothetical protein QW201_02950 [Thermoproteota archaeon]
MSVEGLIESSGKTFGDGLLGLLLFGSRARGITATGATTTY